MNTTLIGSADKTNLTLQLLHEDLPNGLLLIDPDGGIAEAFANTIPVKDTERVFYLDPADLLHPFALNVFDGAVGDQHDKITQDICAYFDAVFPEGKSTLARAQANFILANCLRILLCAPGATLLDVLKVLTDISYRTECLMKCKDPVVSANWEQIERDEKQYQNALTLLYGKVSKLLMSPVIRNIVAQTHNSFSLKDKVVIANLNRAKVGDQTAYFLGSLLLTRAVGPTYITDLGFFASDHLSFSRSGFTVSVRFLAELTPKLRQEVLSFEQKYIFRTNREDAERLAFYVGVSNPNVLTDLSPEQVRNDETFEPQPVPSLKRLPAIRKRSRARHTRPRAEVERAVQTFFAPPKKPRKARRW